MNNIRQIQALNKRELENGVSPEASWHTDYRDTAYVYVGGLPFELSEGDIITVFSQFGEPVHVNLVRDKETGKSKGFAFLKYEDQRSTDLAVDNLGGANVMGRVLRVDHTRYKRKDDEEITDNTEEFNGAGTAEDNDASVEHKSKKRRSSESDSEEGRSRPMMKEEMELAKLIRDHDDDDPMKEYLIREKKEEVDAALLAMKSSSRRSEGRKSRHRHHHRSRRDSRDIHEDQYRVRREHNRHRSRSQETQNRRSFRKDRNRRNSDDEKIL